MSKEKQNIDVVREQMIELYQKAGIALTNNEINSFEIASFGLNDVERTGLGIIVYINTSNYCAKEMVLLPNQTCPEHRHAPLISKKYQGKEETFRCRYGEVYLYVEGIPTDQPMCQPPKACEKYYTVYHEIRLTPGQQYTIAPNTKHWFQGGKNGAVVSEFSSPSFDEYDIFTDTRIVRLEKKEC